MRRIFDSSSPLSCCLSFFCKRLGLKTEVVDREQEQQNQQASSSQSQTKSSEFVSRKFANRGYS